MVTLNDFLSDIGNIDFLKTDIEEMDYFALLGASKLLPHIKFIQFELGLGMPLGESRVTNQDYWDLLESNFELYLLRDQNPIWLTFSELPLLLLLDSNLKKIVEILQTTGAGFNIVGINKKDQTSNIEVGMTGTIFAS